MAKNKVIIHYNMLQSLGILCFKASTVCASLSLSGMDLFEEALQRWEEALTFRSRQDDDDDASCASVTTAVGDAIAEHGMEVRRVTQLPHQIRFLGTEVCFFVVVDE